MLTHEGPKVLEFNVRFGDPEAQVVLPRLDPDHTDLAELLAAAADGRLPDGVPTFTPAACVTVVLAADGYPVAPRTGDVIDGLDAAADLAGVDVYHAATAVDGDGRIVTAGGRVLAVTGRGPTIGAARAVACAAAQCISWPGIQWRSDIALAAAHEQQ
jgi:phosphoribosylamine--glycine ligase